MRAAAAAEREEDVSFHELHEQILKWYSQGLRSCGQNKSVTHRRTHRRMHRRTHGRTDGRTVGIHIVPLFASQMQGTIIIIIIIKFNRFVIFLNNNVSVINVIPS
jgi:hypothetical protein